MNPSEQDEPEVTPEDIWIAEECIARAKRVLGEDASLEAVEFLAGQYAEEWKKTLRGAS